MLVTSIPQTKFGFLFHLDISILSETALPHGGKTERKYITPSVSFFTTKHFNIPGVQRLLSTKEFPNHYVYPKPTKNKRSCLRPPFYLPPAPLQGPCRCSKATDEPRPGDGYFVQVGMGSLGLSGQPFQFHQICQALPLSLFLPDWKPFSLGLTGQPSPFHSILLMRVSLSLDFTRQPFLGHTFFRNNLSCFTRLYQAAFSFSLNLLATRNVHLILRHRDLSDLIH